MEETPKMTPPIAKMHRQPRIVARTCASEQLALSFTIAAGESSDGESERKVALKRSKFSRSRNGNF